MVNEVIFNYLKVNQEKFDLVDLKKEILAKGYSEGDYNEALLAVKAQSPKKFQPGEVSRLPDSKFVDEKKKRFGWLGFFLVFLLILIFGFVAVVALNFLDISIFGFNFFELFDFIGSFKNSFSLF